MRAASCLIWIAAAAGPLLVVACGDDISNEWAAGPGDGSGGSFEQSNASVTGTGSTQSTGNDGNGSMMGSGGTTDNGTGDAGDSTDDGTGDTTDDAAGGSTDDGSGGTTAGDACPNDPNKNAPGMCGCGTPETDGDGDGTPNCIDDCPENDQITDVGNCGCSATDNDQDGFFSCEDECDDNPRLTEKGVCGCDLGDQDNDGVLDCVDECVDEPLLQKEGACGCDPSDNDNDGVLDCVDGCDDDPNKDTPGICGCGIPDGVDNDGDGEDDCNPPPVAFYSHAIVLDQSNPFGTIESGGITARVEFYESSNSNGVTRGDPFTRFRTGGNAQAFNNLQHYWDQGGIGSLSTYPYVGKSGIDRGSDSGETGARQPLGVRDLQMHPPDGPRSTVMIFIAPEAGVYTLTDLGVRRVTNQGVNVRLNVFGPDAARVATLVATSVAWVHSDTTPQFTLAVGDYVHFAVVVEDNYEWDATEVSWTLTRYFPGTEP